MFETIAKYADGWNIASIYLPTPEEYKRKVGELEAICHQVGRSVENIKRALGLGCLIAKNLQMLKEKARRFKPWRYRSISM